jgi:hypothetical protein
MRIIRSLLAVTALSLGAAACEPDRGIIPTQVFGVWTDSMAVRQGVTWANTLDLRPNGEFYWDQITYGGHPYGPDVPVHRTVQHGRYRTRPGVLDLRVESMEFSGVERATTTEEVDDPQWSGDQFRARFSGDDLKITYTSEPFDAPETYTLTFSRKPEGRPID